MIAAINGCSLKANEAKRIEKSSTYNNDINQDPYGVYEILRIRDGGAFPVSSRNL
jgi:hypothetical protein